jgi:dTDP-4-dehydrorhamnose 3,5-epimerase
MKFTPTAIPEVILVEPRIFQDDRGFFMETFEARKFAAAGITAAFVQDNHSGSVQGVLRGLHFQVRQPQGKLVRASVGEVFDVAVDVRPRSSTFRQWVGIHLSATNKQQLWIPPGFAHGFYALSQWAEVSYKVTDFYCPEGERTLIWNDPELQIEWPLVEGRPPMLSGKDAQGKILRELVTAV